MLHLLDQGVEEYLRKMVPLAESAVDISFAVPDRTWGSAVTRPTVNVFLWDLRPNAGMAQAGIRQRLDDNGRTQRRPPGPTIDVRYLVTAWATEHRDEHQLLGSILRCMLANATIDSELLPEPLRQAPVTISVSPEDTRPGDFWNALDGRLRAGLNVVVSTPLEVFKWSEAGPPTEVIAPSISRMRPQESQDVAKSAIRRRGPTGALVMEGRHEDQDPKP